MSETAAMSREDFGSVDLERADVFEVMRWARQLGVTVHDLDLETARERKAVCRLLSSGFYCIIARRKASRRRVRGMMRTASDGVRAELRRLQQRLASRPVFGPRGDLDSLFSAEDLRTLHVCHTSEELKDWRALYTRDETRATWRALRWQYRIYEKMMAPEIKEPAEEECPSIAGPSAN